MFALYSALQLSSKAHSRRLVANSFSRASAGSLVRTFRASACRREQYLDADKETFLKAISKENSQGKVVLVDFYADWCGPCKMLSPILEKLTSTTNVEPLRTGSGRTIDLVTVDTDAETELAQTYQVRSLPTVVAFVDGEPKEKFVGALPEPQVKAFIGQL